jgi:glutamate/tyrosine decarboxylase-like PLP-dependent enzyme
MNQKLEHDLQHLPEILQATLKAANAFLEGVADRPAAVRPHAPEAQGLTDEGLGFEGALQAFKTRWEPGFSGSAGPRYLGFVTGGATPAALAGDWLTSAYDQNAADAASSNVADLESETIKMLCDLFGLPEGFTGSFVTGATISNFVGLALGRQWIADKHGRDAAQDGLYGLPLIKVLSGAAHSSTFKALSMLGMGRANLTRIPTLKDREAVDLNALRRALEQQDGQACIVVANAGTVNTVDFDDLSGIADLKQEFDFWLHTDAAFGGFAAISPRFAHLTRGLERSDSVCIDAHKWLNVPYDAAMQFTRHRALQARVFQNSAAYLGPLDLENPGLVHLTPENSRRLRALPAWFALQAYGRDGHREIVERNCDAARDLGEKIEHSSAFKLLAPVRMNVVCFTLAGNPDQTRVSSFIEGLRDAGQVFLTPTVLHGVPSLRAAFSNWRTQGSDVEIAWQSMLEIAQKIL